MLLQDLEESFSLQRASLEQELSNAATSQAAVAALKAQLAAELEAVAAERSRLEAERAEVEAQKGGSRSAPPAADAGSV